MCPIFYLISRIANFDCLRGMKLEFLPPYSPDFNPIELAFSLIKSSLRRKGCPDRNTCPGERSDQVVYDQLTGLVLSISVEDCRAFFRHSGYIL